MSVLTFAREIMPDPPAALEAVMDDIRVGPRVSRDEYQRRMDAERGPEADRMLLPADNQRLGIVVLFDATVRGLRDEVVDVCWTLYAIDVRLHALVGPLDDGCSRLGRPKADIVRLSSDVWVPLPPVGGRYIVHLAIYEHAQRLDLAYTRAFRVRT